MTLKLAGIPWEASGAVMQEGDTDGRFRKTVFLESGVLLVGKALAFGAWDVASSMAFIGLQRFRGLPFTVLHSCPFTPQKLRKRNQFVIVK